MSGPTLEVRVKSVTFEAERINSYELRAAAGGTLPPFKAGAHVDVHNLPHGATRSYSLINPEGETHRYVIGVARDDYSTGGSRYMHESVRPGDMLTISPPANNFALAEDAGLSIFIAGGIGITPIFCMVQRLTTLGHPWQLHYSARTRDVAAFLEPLEALRGDGRSVAFNFDYEPGGKMLDVGAIVAAAPAAAHLYCCGPTGMLEAFERATGGLPKDRVHVEYFSSKRAPARAGGFTVVLAKSNRTVFVEEGKTILETLIESGMNPYHSCMEGVCGTCETRILEGTPDHRDMVLNDAEKASNKTMMICCSGAKTATLVLDL